MYYAYKVKEDKFYSSNSYEELLKWVYYSRPIIGHNKNDCYISSVFKGLHKYTGYPIYVNEKLNIDYIIYDEYFRVLSKDILYEDAKDYGIKEENRIAKLKRKNRYWYRKRQKFIFRYDPVPFGYGSGHFRQFRDFKRSSKEVAFLESTKYLNIKNRRIVKRKRVMDDWDVMRCREFGWKHNKKRKQWEK